MSTAVTTTEIDLNKNPKFILCLGWIIALTWMAVLPHSLFNPLTQKVSRAFSWGHIIGYAIMAFLLCPYLRSCQKFFKINMTFRNSILIALSITALWGTFTEILQFASFDRSPNLWDIVLDCFGALIGISVYAISGSFRLRIQQ